MADGIENGDTGQRNPANDANHREDLSQELTEKLLHFQEISNIDDLDECKRILRRHAWNVESAVQSTFMDRNPPEPQVNIPPPVMQPTLRHRNIGTISPPLPLRNISRTNLYQARRTVRLRQPQGFIGWGYYILALPFRFTWTTLFGIVRFFIRLFVPDPRMRLVNPLGDVQEFVTEYDESYAQHPEFFRGTYADAQNESRRQMKLLLIYLHDPDHEDTNEFCSATLSSDDVIEFVQRNFVFWACSVQKPEGYRVSRAMRENTHPFMAMICLIQGKMTVVGRFEGPLTPQEFLEQVSAIVVRFEPTLVAARADREERDMTQLIRSEQDEAYKQSLMQDKEKEEKKKREEEIRLKKEEELAKKQRIKEEAEENFIRRRQSCKDLLSREPVVSDPDSLQLVIKLPDGSRLTRVFLSTEPVKAIHDYIFSQDNAPRQFQVVRNFPRKVIPGCSTSEILTLEKAEEPSTRPKLVAADDGPDNYLDTQLGISIAQAGIKSCETLFVQAIDDTDDEDDSASER